MKTRLVFFLALVVGFCAFRVAVAGESDPAPMYVDSKAIKDRFSSITAQDMELLRGKKILLMSRSFGLNTIGGLTLLAKEDKKYDLLSSCKRFGFGKDDGSIPPDVFSKLNFVHCAAAGWPINKRIDDMDQLLRNAPTNFGKTVDVAFLFCCDYVPANFDYYAQKMDALQAAFPNVKIIYACSGFHGPKFGERNEQAQAFSEKVRARYKGNAPVFDMGKILSDDFRVGHVYCPEYSKDPTDGHPNLPAGEIALAKGFLLTLVEALRAPTATRVQLAPLNTAQPIAPKTEVLPADHPDVKAVRAILDANGLSKKAVENVAVVENGRIVKLYLQECGLINLTSSIGALTELRLLHLYGDRKLPFPLLKSIDPAIGKCTKLEELLLNNNELTTLPDSMANLTKLKFLSLADNRLQNLAVPVTDWAKRFDPKGLEMQNPSAR